MALQAGCKVLWPKQLSDLVNGQQAVNSNPALADSHVLSTVRRECGAVSIA